MQDRRVAVIGMALRFPGADTPARYWDDIRSGASHVRPFTDAEFATAGLPEALYRAPDFTGASALLPDIDGFDAAFFGMSGREATLTDPQQRLFLECCHHALEDGGHAGTSERVGVYASIGYRLYSLHSYLANQIGRQGDSAAPADPSVSADPAASADPGASVHPGASGDWSGGWSGDWAEVKQIQVGNYPDFTANRAAFRLGLTGPAVNVATACSSGLVSVHLACQALLAGDADLMVVGSAALHLPQITGHRHVRGSTISPTGAVRAFDAAADGTVGGNGVAAVLLKPLARALADGDTVHGVILGSAVTNDGADKAGFAAPGAAGQRDAVLGALANAGVGADTIGYLEAHGTGTYKGDPIEFAALTEAYRRYTDRTGFCALGSTKPAIGHLDSAAGLAGLIKALLVLRHATIPPLVNLTRPNPLLGVENSPFTLPRQAASWAADGPRRAGVHSIGMGGTNAHVILEEAPAAPARPPAGPVPALLPLSAQSPRALEDSARALRDTLRRRPDLAPADVLTTLALGRRHLRHRLVVTAPAGRLAEALDAYLADPARYDGVRPPATRVVAPARGDGATAHHTGTVEAKAPTAPAFVFSGQGSGRPGMAGALAARFPRAAEVLRECARIHREETGEDHFLPRIVAGEGPGRWDTAFAQPAIFALQVAQARLWRHLGVTPSAVAGHSVGEYAALCVAGALTVEAGMRLLCRRGRLMQGTEPGAMLAVFSPLERVRELLDALGRSAHGRLELAVSNGPAQHVVAGRPAAVAAARSWLAERGETSEPLPVDRAFHTALLDPVLDEFRAIADKAELQPVQVDFVSGLDGRTRPVGWLPDADYLVRQARHTADFHAVLGTLAPVRVLVELGHGAPLTGLARRAVPDVTCVPTWPATPVRREGGDPGTDPDGPWTAVARLHCAGVAVDWAALLDGCAGRRVPLPLYPFQHRSYWTGPPPHSGPEADRAPTNQGSMEDGMTERDVLRRVLELTARHLGYDLAEVRAGQTFIGLGADSLQLIGMLRQLEAEFGVRIAIRDVLEDAGTPELTARLIASRSSGAPGSPVDDDASGSSGGSGGPLFAEPGEPAPLTVLAPAPPAGSAPVPVPAPVSALRSAPVPAPALVPAPVQAAAAESAHRAEIAELSRQIDLLAETQAAMLVQLSEALNLLGVERAR